MSPVINQDFYNRYHRQNNQYHGVIDSNNFTYWYILRSLEKALAVLPKFMAKPSMEPSRTVEGLNFLDVGCGVGSVALYLASRGATVVGIDVSSRALSIAESARAQAGLDSVRFAVSVLGWGSGQFDCVICTEVIEHVPDDSDFADRLYSQLKPGGVVLLSTPSSQSLMYRFGWYQEFDARVGHLRRYTQASIGQVLEQAGFQLESVTMVEGFLRNMLFTTALGFLIKAIRGPLVPIFHWFDALSVQLAGPTDIIVIARKPKTI